MPFCWLPLFFETWIKLTSTDTWATGSRINLRGELRRSSRKSYAEDEGRDVVEILYGIVLAVSNQKVVK